MASPSAVLQSEWTKIKTVRSTVWTLIAALLVTLVISGLFALITNSQWDTLSAQDRATFDPTNLSFSGLWLGQLALIVFGVLVVTSEYSTGMIRASLAAVPQRGLFFFAKMVITTGLAFIVGMATSFICFFVGQALLGDHSTTIDSPGVLRAVFGAGIYMTMMVLFSAGVSMMFRSPMLSLGILMPFFFLISIILGNAPVVKKFGKYLPDQAGQKIMQVVQPANNDAPYGPWAGLGIMAVWVVAALLGGYLVLKRRDA
ncbi:ABC transporter permease [Streptomyces sp. H10-C2]|uniref:ABC transporter permease n=1 Tax=unclassified Streptomyces TaxID=2593676 RepID=UPI0024B8827D|nr:MULTISPECIES: ABC transporter permease [unclassified Streptomyces]MDJ0341511.1 ABC transporter permease [Streptomyces sp. PH10-H1]MDJ0369168.1 ABC transporter permease [Streptomyces sp. H10-C2]